MAARSQRCTHRCARAAAHRVRRRRRVAFVTWRADVAFGVQPIQIGSIDRPFLSGRVPGPYACSNLSDQKTHILLLNPTTLYSRQEGSHSLLTSSDRTPSRR